MLTTDKNILTNYTASKCLWIGIPSIEVTKGGRTFLTFYSGGVKEEIGNYVMLVKSDDGVNFGEPIAVCFAAALFFSPLFLAIPSAATAPVLIIVGLMMFSSVKELPTDDMSEAIPAFITIITMPLAYSVADGILLGVISYVVMNLLSGKHRKLSPGMYVLAVLFTMKYIFL